MASMLHKEFIVLRTFILVYLAAAVLFITQVMEVNGPPAFMSLLAFIFTISTTAHEDKNNSHILLNSLPVSRKEIVTAKYMFHIVFGIVLVGIALIIRAAFGEWSSETALWQTAISVTVIVWFVSVFFPMYFWLGPRFVQIGMIVFFIMMFAVVPTVYNLGVKHNFWGIPDVVESFSDTLLFAILTAVTVIFLTVSWLISVWLYERKQF